MTICFNCQWDNPAGSKFCNNCGKWLAAAAAAADVPAWLQAAEQAAPSSQPADVTWLEELPLTGLDLPSVQAAPVNPSPAAVIVSPATQADLPDWLVELTPRGAGLFAAAESPTTPEKTWFPQTTPPAEPPERPADLPDWLADLAPLEAAAPTAGPAETNFWLNSLSPASDLPDWLTTLDVKGLDLDGVLAEVAADRPPAALLDGKMAEVEEGGPMVGAQEWSLPDWVQRLKPAADEPAPLTALERPIAIEPVIVAPHDPGRRPAFRVTPEQEQQVAWLRQVTEAAEPALPSERPTLAALSPGIRLVVGLLLLLAAGLGEWSAAGVAPTPAKFSPAIHSTLAAASGRPVLVAFDYTPALAGELDHLVQPTLAELAANGSPVVAISQYPAGLPLVGRWLGKEALFLPGEAVGLRALAGCLGGEQPCPPPPGQLWAEELQRTLGQVALVIVFTGDQGSLVNWLEQVGPATDAPLVMGVTQALAPVASVYLSSGRLAGVLGGFLPAAGLSGQTWLVGLVALLLLASNLVYLIKRER